MSASSGSVGHPELSAVLAVISDEKDSVADNGEVERERAAVRVDVSEEVRAGIAAIADPQFVTSDAVVRTKKSRGPATVKCSGDDGPARLISLIILVPASVPSVTHSSVPLVPSLAVKNRRSRKTVKLSGIEGNGPGKISFTRDSASLRSISREQLAIEEVSSLILSDLVVGGEKDPAGEWSEADGHRPLHAGMKSITRCVPAIVPSVLHSS